MLCGNGWMKTVGDKINEFKKERPVALEGLRAILVICQQPYNYRKTVVRAGGVGFVLSLWEEYDDDDEAVELSCAIFGFLSKTSKDRFNADHGKVGAVVRKMVQVVHQNSNLQAKMEALTTLCNLWKQKSKNRTIMRNTIDQVVVSVGNKFADSCAAVLLDERMSEELAGSVVSLLCELSLGHERNGEGELCLATEFLSEVLANTAQRFAGSRMVVESSFEMLEMIDASRQQKRESKTASGYGEILCDHPALFASLVEDAGSDPSAAVSLVRALRESGALERNVLDSGVFEALIAAMSKFRNSEGVQSESCLLLSEAIQRGSEACIFICAQSGLPVIADALCRYGENEAVAESGCCVLLLALRRCSFDSLSETDTRILITQALVSTMGGGGGETASAGAMDTFIECVQFDADYFKHMSNHPGAIRAVVTSMNKYPRSQNVQKAGCNFLRILSRDPRKQQIKERIGCEGGVAAIMKSLEFHGHSPAVCSVALSAISRLSMTVTNNAQFEQNGGTSALLQYVEPQMGNPEIVSSLFMALNNIIVESPESRSVAAVDEAMIQVLDASMRRFPREEKVQKTACKLLSSCSYRPSNLEVMRLFSQSIVPLLTRAADVFPESCWEASNLVRRHLHNDR